MYCRLRDTDVLNCKKCKARAARLSVGLVEYKSTAECRIANLYKQKGDTPPLQLPLSSPEDDKEIWQ